MRSLVYVVSSLADISNLLVLYSCGLAAFPLALTHFSSAHILFCVEVEARLLDMNIWLPVVLVQLAGFVGPVLLPSISDAVFKLSSYFGSHQRHYKTLSDRVKKAVQRDPGRRYYLTGHTTLKQDSRVNELVYRK